MIFSANVPFDRFESITKGLYPAITALKPVKQLSTLNHLFPFKKRHLFLARRQLLVFRHKVVNGGAFLQPDSNTLTITGSGFGTATGSAAIIFADPDNGGSGITELPATSSLIISWSDNEVKLKFRQSPEQE
jgi:hypothetical protein